MNSPEKQLETINITKRDVAKFQVAFEGYYNVSLSTEDAAAMLLDLVLFVKSTQA